MKGGEKVMKDAETEFFCCLFVLLILAMALLCCL